MFFNACSLVETSLEPLPLLEMLLALENQWGRIRGPKPNHARAAARTLDLDLIWMEGTAVHSPRLSLPHTRACSRGFVLGPLLDLDPWLGGRLTLPNPLTGEPCCPEDLWLLLPEAARNDSQPVAEPIDPIERAA